MNITDYLFSYSKGLNKNLILGPKEQMPYKAIYANICNIAGWLRKQNIKKGEKILLHSDNSIFFILCYFGIIKSGLTCVPIDVKTNEKNLDLILNSCDIKFGFIQSKWLYKYNNYNFVKIADLEDLDFSENVEYDSISTITDIDENNDVAVIIFTSGSTGDVKGVMLSHSNIQYNTESIVEYLNLKEYDIHQVVLPFYYCFGASLLHTHVLIGGSLVINNEFIFPNTVPELIEKYGCTGISGVPSVFQILCRKSSFKSFPMPSLRFMAQAGGFLPVPFIKELINAFPDKELFIMYGQTEATARLSYLPSKYLETKIGSIGKGIPGVNLEVLGEDGLHVQPGQEGEIVATGLNIMLGYYKDDKLTNKKIIKGKLYTEDLAKIDDDGFIYITGRKSTIIKSAGYRISPKEIENIISELPEVQEIAVIGIDDAINGESLKAIIVTNKKNNLSKETVIKCCRDNLPEYKVPKRIEFVIDLPKNSSGKILYHKLT